MAGPDSVLAEMEEQGSREHIPIVVPETGALLHVLALASGARRILEVGTAIGVSTLYLARALPEGGQVVSFEIDAERHGAAREYLERAGVLDRADLRLQDAREGLAALEGEFDMAFVDGVKTPIWRVLRQGAFAQTLRWPAGGGQRPDERLSGRGAQRRQLDRRADRHRT